MPRFTARTGAEAGKRGGRATVERHGRDHMAKIGARGFAATVARHWGGNRKRFIEYLRCLALRAIDPFPQNGAWQRRVPRPDSLDEEP